MAPPPFGVVIVGTSWLEFPSCLLGAELLFVEVGSGLYTVLSSDSFIPRAKLNVKRIAPKLGAFNNYTSLRCVNFY